MTTTTNQIEFTRINNDINENPRYVCHFLAFINNKVSLEYHEKYGLKAITEMYNYALKLSRQLGGKKFHNKQYGGGIVFQMYSGKQAEMSQKINEIANK
jgi:hypothetical protein